MNNFIPFTQEMIDASVMQASKRNPHIKHHFESATMDGEIRDQVGFLGEFACCEALGLSGIVALFVYGSTIRDITSEHMKSTVSSLSEIVEAYVYIMLGLAWQNYSTANWGISFMILVACVVSRVIVVFVLGGDADGFEGQ